MSTDVQTPAEVAVEKNDPYQLLRELGGPTREEVAAMKARTPNGRVKIFTTDGKSAYLLRAIGGLELAELQKHIPANATNPEADIAIQAAALCTLWTNATAEKKLTEIGLRTGSAGRPASLWSVIAILSDFTDPQDLTVCSAEL